jgi:MFS family permease
MALGGGENPYRRVLGAPHVLRLAAGAVVARLPVGMGAIAIVIFVHEQSGSFGAAGAAVGAFTLGLGGTSPLLGRLVDRRGPRPVLIPAATLTAAGLAGLVLLGELGAGAAPMVLATAIAGCGSPPIGGVLRQLWDRLVDEELLITAYVVDSVLIEVFFIAGPLLTGLLAATAGAAAALLVAAALGLTGTVWFASSPVVGAIEPAPSHHHTRAGALASPVIRVLVTAGVPLGVTFGALDVALPAFGASHGSTALGGPFGAALATGSALGALLYGASPQRFGDAGRVSIVLSILQPLFVLPLLLAPSIPVMLVLGLLAGSFIAPSITARSQIVQRSLPPGTATEAFSWLSLSFVVGASAGSAIAGPVVEAGGWRAGVALAAVLPALGIPLILARRGLLEAAASSELKVKMATATSEGD